MPILGTERKTAGDGYVSATVNVCVCVCACVRACACV